MASRKEASDHDYSNNTVCGEGNNEFECCESPRNIHIIGCFFPRIGGSLEKLFHRRYYKALKNRLVEQGFRAHISKVGVSYRNFYETVDLVKCEREEMFGNEPVTYIGHSLGGIVSIGVLFKYPENTARVIGIATPTRNPPCDFFASKVYKHTGVSEEIFFKHEEEILRLSDKITLISAEDDPIAPSSNCIIETKDGRRGMARHIELNKEFPERNISHSRMPIDKHVISIVIDIINNKYEKGEM